MNPFDGDSGLPGLSFLWSTYVTEEQLVTLLSLLPDAALVPVGWLRAQLQRPEIADDGVADLSCADVAKRLDRRPGTIRAWCQRGEMAGAYRLNKKEWRIPRASVRAYLDAQAKQGRVVNAGPVDLGSWRGK